MSLVEHIISAIAPHICVGCKTEGRLLCRNCEAALPAVVKSCYACQKATDEARTCDSCRRHTVLYRVQALTYYKGMAKQLVWRLKFERARAAGVDMGRLIAPLLPSDEKIIIAPVPTAAKRVRQRGYNQATVIARTAAHGRGVVCASLLLRLGSARQVGGTRAERREQIKGAFRVRKPHVVRGAHIILIDDVLTTGATLEAAAATLKNAGAKKVEAVVFARA